MATLQDARERIVFAVDVSRPQAALDLVLPLKDSVGAFKLGLEYITAALAGMLSPATDFGSSIEQLQLHRQLIAAIGPNLMYDGKFPDIPNTVGGASAALQPLSPKIFNVHASAGAAAVKAAVENRGDSWVFGVTVLTSITPEECISIFGAEPGAKVVQFAHMLADAGAQGIICSPQELELLGKDGALAGLMKLTPGVRPAWAAVGDQKRVMTPGDAIRAGAWGLVIGRPIGKPPAEIGTPVDAATLIAKEILVALQEREALAILARNNAVIVGDHFVYKSGRHGTAYVNKDAVYPDAVGTSELCRSLAELFSDQKIEVVVGPAMGGIILSQWTAYHLTQITGRQVDGVYAEKNEEGKFVLRRGYADKVRGKRALVVEDVLTTGGSAKSTVDACHEGKVVGVGAVCNRGGVTAADIGAPTLYALVNVTLEDFAPEECPSCKADVPVNTELGHGKQFLESQQQSG